MPQNPENHPGSQELQELVAAVGMYERSLQRAFNTFGLTTEQIAAIELAKGTRQNRVSLVYRPSDTSASIELPSELDTFLHEERKRENRGPLTIHGAKLNSTEAILSLQDKSGGLQRERFVINTLGIMKDPRYKISPAALADLAMFTSKIAARQADRSIVINSITP